MLMMVHVGISGVTKTPEMILEQTEADLLAEASVNVMREFDIKPDPRAEAVIGLIIAAGTVYGPRYYLIKQRQKTEQGEPQMGKATPYEPERDEKGQPKFDAQIWPTMAPGSTTQI